MEGTGVDGTGVDGSGVDGSGRVASRNVSAWTTVGIAFLVAFAGWVLAAVVAIWIVDKHTDALVVLIYLAIAGDYLVLAVAVSVAAATLGRLGRLPKTKGAAALWSLIGPGVAGALLIGSAIQAQPFLAFS